jgi:copper transport protein
VRRLLVVAALALAFPGSALAHASLEETRPGFRERLVRPPATVVLRFDQGVKVLPGGIDVRNSAGRLFSRAARNGADPRLATAALRHLPRGAYTVRWHVLSADGHVISGVYTFGVGVAAPPPTEAYGASGPTRTEHVVRWAYFLALALLLGGVGFRLLVVRGPLPPAAERRFYRVTGLGAVAVLEVGIVAFILRAEDALQLPFGRLLYSDLSPIAGGTRFGTAFIAMTLGFALVTAFLYLAWLTERPALLWPAFLVGLGFASGLSLSGHSAVDAGSSWLSQLADWVHLCAAVLWVGGLVQLVAVVWPAAPELRRTAFLRFSRLATVLVALLVTAGVYLSVLRLPHVHDLWSEGYGRVLLVKLGLVSVALTWGAVHHFLARPALERGGGESVLARLPRSLAGESAVAMAILLAAAVLVDSKPPPQPVPQPAQVANVRR